MRKGKTIATNRSPADISPEEERKHSKHPIMKKRVKGKVVYVKTREDSFGQGDDDDDLWVVIDMKTVIK